MSRTVRPATGLVPQAHDRLDRLVRAGHGEPPADDDLLDAQALGERRQPAGDRVELVEGQVDDGPDVEQDPVPLQAVRVGELGPRPADRVQAADEDVLDLRQGDDAAVVVAHRRHVADLGHGDRAARSDGMSRATQSNRWTSPGDGRGLISKFFKPPHLQATGDHRVQAAELDVLGEGLRVRTPTPSSRADAVRRRPVGT